MRLKYISVLLASLLVLIACSENHEPVRGDEDEEHTYSFTAVLDGPKTRLGYQEDPDSHDLKMVWDEGDVIRLYPDPSMNDNTPYYEFVPNTGVGTSHTVFVHQGYITNWEHWKGKAIYVFPDGDNLDVEDDSEEFLAKAYVQKANDNTEHLKYGEFVPTADGKKSYTGYWAAFLDDANLKHDHKHVFEHRHTLVYKIMLRGFLFDVPGGSQLRMSGDAWPDGEVTTLTLGDKDDEEPFLSVEKPYGQSGYNNKVLTAYIIRQITDGEVDGSINPGSTLKFELLTYDKNDGNIIKLDDNDRMPHRLKADGSRKEDYFTNIPWGDEYTWTVKADRDVTYRAGDYVVADLTADSGNKYPPLVAIDLGLPVKWGACNLGATKPEEYGKFVLWSSNKLYDRASIYDKNPLEADDIAKGNTWKSGDPDYDAATNSLGSEWRTPTQNEIFDLLQYAIWTKSNTDDNPTDKNSDEIWNLTLEQISNIVCWTYANVNNVPSISEHKVLRVRSSLKGGNFLYVPLPGYADKYGPKSENTAGYYIGVDAHSFNNSSFNFARLRINTRGTENKCVVENFPGNQGNYFNAVSVRPVKD